MANFSRIFLLGDIMQDGAAGHARLQDFLTTHPDALVIDENVFANVSGYASTVADEISLILEPLCLPQNEMKHRMGSVAHALGIDDLLDQNPFRLSGGQTQLVALASIFVGEPKPLVLHALLQGLDVQMRQRVLALVDGWDADVLWTNPAQPFAEEERLATEILGEEPASNHLEALTDILWNLSPVALRAEGLGISPSVTYTAGTRKLFKRQVKPKALIDNLNLHLKPGDLLMLRGNNGAGKTTLAKTLAGLLQPVDGAVLVGDTPVHALKPEDRVHRIAMVGQHPQHRAIASTVAKDLRIGPATTADNDYLMSLIDALGLRKEFDQNKHPLDLTVGQQTLLSIINALLTRPAILVLDEPTVHLSQSAQQKLLNLIHSYRHAGGTVIGISHSSVFDQAESVIELNLSERKK